MSPASEIRAAAAKIRDLAGQATPGPWWREYGGAFMHGITSAAGDRVAPVGIDRHNVHHIALWDPVVAERVAKLLDISGDWWADMERQNARAGIHTRVLPNAVDEACLDLARTINSGGDDK